MKLLFQAPSGKNIIAEVDDIPNIGDTFKLINDAMPNPGMMECKVEDIELDSKKYSDFCGIRIILAPPLTVEEVIEKALETKRTFFAAIARAQAAYKKYGVTP